MLIIIFTCFKIVDILLSNIILKLENIIEGNFLYYIFKNNIITFILWQITPILIFLFYNLKNRHNIRKLEKVKMVEISLIIILLIVVIYSAVLGIINI